MIESIDIDADLREGEHGTDLIDGEIRFSEEVTLPSEEHGESRL